jgi:hypothetical protein
VDLCVVENYENLFPERYKKDAENELHLSLLTLNI